MPCLIKIRLTGYLLAILLSGNVAADSNVAPVEIHLGNISNNSIEGGSDETALGLTTTFGPQRFHPNLRLYIDLWIWGSEVPNEEFSACLFCSVNSEVDVSVLAFGVGLSGAYPLGNLQIYAQAGLSLAMIDYKLGGSFLGIPGAVEEDGDSELTLQYGFGLAYAIGHRSVGIHYRHFDIESSSNTFSIQDVEIGGDYVGLSFGWNF